VERYGLIVRIFALQFHRFFTQRAFVHKAHSPAGAALRKTQSSPPDLQRPAAGVFAPRFLGPSLFGGCLFRLFASFKDIIFSDALLADRLSLIKDLEEVRGTAASNVETTFFTYPPTR